jgi:hypothetical protein
MALTCRVCGRQRGPTARAENVMCRACAGKTQGRKRGKAYAFASETAKDKAMRKPTNSWWTEPRADYVEAAKRMAGNGWEL